MLRQSINKYSKLRFPDGYDMVYTRLYIAGAGTLDASIWNTESGAAYTVQNLVLCVLVWQLTNSTSRHVYH